MLDQIRCNILHLNCDITKEQSLVEQQRWMYSQPVGLELIHKTIPRIIYMGS